MNDVHAIWNILSGGTVTAVTGQVPGEVTVTVTIPSLVAAVGGSGASLQVVLHDCHLFQFDAWDDDVTVRDLAAIGPYRPRIMNVKPDAAPVSIYTNRGLLRARCEGITCLLESGMPVSLTALAETGNRLQEQAAS